MRFESTLLTSWSRREWLSVAVVAATTAFLVGSVVLLLTVGSYTSTLEGDLQSSATVTYDDSYETAVAAADSDDVVFAITRVDIDEKGTEVVLGVPPDAPRRIETASVAWNPARVPDPPDQGLAGPVNQPTLVRIDGSATHISPHDSQGSLFSEQWYIGSATTVTSFGDAGALTIDTGASGGRLQWLIEGAPLVAAIPFLIRGVDQILQTLAIGAVGGGFLVLVVVYNVMRMAISDRHRDLRVARSTGASPTRLFGVLVGRVLALTGTGVLLGFALGLIATNLVINAATYVGLPVTIQTVITAPILQAILLVGGFLLVMGLLAGVIASVPVVRGDPAFIGAPTTRTRSLHGRAERLQAALQPTFIHWRAIVPTTTTLTVFVLVVLLVTAVGGAIAPLATTQSGTVIEAGAAHPLNSRIDEGYASVLRAQNVTASPEVLYAQTHDGDPYLVRGANYTAFSEVSEATLVEGHAPRAYDQAVIGSSLAETLDIHVGETITLGGSVTPGVRRLTVVGQVSGSGITDDQLIVPLSTAQELATGSGSVHLIRTDSSSIEFERFSNDSGGIVVTDLSGDERIKAGTLATITVDARNIGRESAAETITVSAGTRTQTRHISIPAGESTRTEVAFRFENPGNYVIEADGIKKTVQVYDPRTLVLPEEYPTRAPPGSTLIVPATTPSEALVSDATVTLADRQRTTGPQGAVPIRIPSDAGEYTLTIAKDNYTSEQHTIIVEEGAPRRFTARLTVTPESGSRLTNPTVTVQLANPWGQILERNVTLVTPGETERRTVRLAGGEVTQINVSAAEAGLGGELAPGTYDLRVVSDESVLATTTYRVTGDRRVTSTLASQVSYSQGTGVGRAIENVFGNVQVLSLVMISLAGLSTVGGTAATFAHAVHANRRRIGIYRATGASRRQLLGALVRDAITLAVPAAVVAFSIAFACLWALAEQNFLVVFGIKMEVSLSPTLLAGSIVGALTLAVTSALGVGYAFLVSEPDQLLRAD